ncbi:MAG: LysR family transcriptional regulator [Pseudonocardia sp.]
MLNPGYLRTLQEVLRRGSFAGAAAHLGYTPSAVSQQMAALERETGTLLFERMVRQVRPTPAAHVVARRGEMILAQIEQLRDDLDRVQADAADTLRVGCFPTAAAHLVPDVFDGWTDRFGIELLVAEPTSLETALTSTCVIDLAIVYHFYRSPAARPRDTDAIYLFDDVMRAVLPAEHPLAERADVTLEELAQWPWIGHPSGTTGARSIERFCLEVGIKPRIVAESNEYPAMLGLVRAGMGIALVPTLALQTPEPGVTVRDLVGVRCGREVFALVRANETSPQAAQFLERTRAAVGRRAARDARLA